MHILIGKTIRSIDIAEDRRAIRFVLDNDSVVAVCYGDGYSETWIEDVIGLDAAIGSSVLTAADIELPDDMRRPTNRTYFEEDVMEYYGFALTTANGRFLVAYRNSSNGYYSGCLHWPGDYSDDSTSSSITWKPAQEGS